MTKNPRYVTGRVVAVKNSTDLDKTDMCHGTRATHALRDDNTINDKEG